MRAVKERQCLHTWWSIRISGGTTHLGFSANSMSVSASKICEGAARNTFGTPTPALNVSILLVARTKHAPGILIWVFGGLRRHLVQGVRVGGGQDLPGAHGEHAKPDPQEEVTAGRVVALQGR